MLIRPKVVQQKLYELFGSKSMEHLHRLQITNISVEDFDTL